MVDFITPLQLGPAPTTRYKWQNHSQHPCHDCEHLDGQVRTMQEWLFVRQHPHCRCSLEPVEEVEDGILFTPDLTGLIYFNLDGSISSIAKDPQPSILGGQITWPTLSPLLPSQGFFTLRRLKLPVNPRTSKGKTFSKHQHYRV